MIDRGSILADAEMVALLRTRTIPVAIDQAYERRQDDEEGRFYRRIASQGPRSDFQRTTQGFYVASPAGELLLYHNHRGPERVRPLVEEAVTEFLRRPEDERRTEAVEREGADVERDPRYSPVPPEGGLVVRVRARVLGGYDEPRGDHERVMQGALSRDNLWITAAEHRALAEGRVAATLARRIARFHLVDNTRGEPPMWRDAEVRSIDLRLSEGVLSGRADLATEDGSRTFRAALRGRVNVDDGRVTSLVLVARGLFRGEGRYTRGAPEGEFPLAIAFTLADGKDVADAIPPQGSRGWVAGYLR